MCVCVCVCVCVHACVRACAHALDSEVSEVSGRELSFIIAEKQNRRLLEVLSHNNSIH